MYYNVYDTCEEAVKASESYACDVEVMPLSEGYALVSVSDFLRQAKDEAGSLFNGGWRPGEDTSGELVAEYGEDNPAWTHWAETINGYLAEILADWEPIDADSFGAECPENWEEIAGALNRIIRETGKDPDQVWEDYCSERLADVPEAKF